MIQRSRGGVPEPADEAAAGGQPPGWIDCVQPDISVVIPTFRRPTELAEAIASVARQKGVSTELIVIDDCGAGSAAPAIARFPDLPLTYLRMETPTGGRPALVRNKGWQHARGAVVHFLDDDDLVPDGYYAAATEVFRREPSTDVVFGRVEPFAHGVGAITDETLYFQDATARARRCGRFGRTQAFAATMFFKATLLVCGAAMIRRERIAPLGGFDERLPLVEDVDFYARAIRRFGVRFLDRLALHYRIGPSLMHGPDRQAPINASYRQMHERYRSEWGALDFYRLKLLSRLIAG